MQTIASRIVDTQVLPFRIWQEEILEALRGVDRKAFLPNDFKGCPTSDDIINLGQGRVILPPSMLGRLMSMGYEGFYESALVIASASGYETAVCSKLISTTLCLESQPVFSELTEKNLETFNADNIISFSGDLKKGLSGHGPYDFIFINGGVNYIPATLFDQLSPMGTLVAVLIKEEHAGTATAFKKVEGRMKEEKLFDAYVPELPEFSVEKSFEF